MVTVGWWLLGLSLLTFVGSLVALPILVVRMPADYFVDREAAPDSWRHRHPAIRFGVRFAKNLVGAILLAAGVVMLFVPGQGILAILLGLSLMDLPGKRALELRLIETPTVLRAVNAIRARAGRAPLEIPARVARTASPPDTAET